MECHDAIDLDPMDVAVESGSEGPTDEDEWDDVEGWSLETVGFEGPGCSACEWRDGDPTTCSAILREQN